VVSGDAAAVHVVGLGAQTSIGLTLPTTVAAVHGAINRFSTAPHLRDRATGEPIVLARLGSIPLDVPVIERMRRLAAAAAEQAIVPWIRASAPPSGDAARLRVVLAVPPARPGFSGSAGARLGRELLGGLPTEVDALGSAQLEGTHTAGLAAVAHAAGILRRGEAEAVLVGGVDSYVDIDTLHWIEAQGRLRGEEKPFGVIPGEGAGFALLASARFLERHALRSFGEIVRLAEGVEENPWYTQRPSTAEALSRAIFGVIGPTSSEPQRADVTYADLNGEAWRAEEWSLAYVRTGPWQGHPLDLRHPADCWGDVGAATGPLLVGMACLDFHQGRNKGKTALVWTAADVLPYRAACLVARPEP
jgi:3-oxoacyl-[acyl-carrier-protein] synthase-1